MSVLKNPYKGVRGLRYSFMEQNAPEELARMDAAGETEEYLKALIEYYDAFIADDRKAIAELDELDVISSNIIQDHVQELEKFQWFMRSHLA